MEVKRRQTWCACCYLEDFFMADIDWPCNEQFLKSHMFSMVAIESILSEKNANIRTKINYSIASKAQNMFKQIGSAVRGVITPKGIHLYGHKKSRNLAEDMSILSLLRNVGCDAKYVMLTICNSNRGFCDKIVDTSNRDILTYATSLTNKPELNMHHLPDRDMFCLLLKRYQIALTFAMMNSNVENILIAYALCYSIPNVDPVWPSEDLMQLLLHCHHPAQITEGSTQLPVQGCRNAEFTPTLNEEFKADFPQVCSICEDFNKLLDTICADINCHSVECDNLSEEELKSIFDSKNEVMDKIFGIDSKIKQINSSETQFRRLDPDLDDYDEAFSNKYTEVTVANGNVLRQLFKGLSASTIVSQESERNRLCAKFSIPFTSFKHGAVLDNLQHLSMLHASDTTSGTKEEECRGKVQWFPDTLKAVYVPTTSSYPGKRLYIVKIKWIPGIMEAGMKLRLQFPNVDLNFVIDDISTKATRFDASVNLPDSVTDTERPVRIGIDMCDSESMTNTSLFPPWLTQGHSWDTFRKHILSANC